MNTIKNHALVLTATLLTLAVNAAANILPINNVTTAAVSDSFQTYFVPAGYVFSIWGVIYLLLLGFSAAYSYLVNRKAVGYLEEVTPWYVGSAIANIIWIFSWHYGYYLTTAVAMVGILIALISIHRILDKHAPKSYAELLLAQLPFHIYIAWISVASIANISNVLWYYGFTGFGLAGQYWAAIMIIVAGALTGLVTLLTRNIAFTFVVAWAVVGIMVKFSTETPILVSGALTLVYITAILGYKVLLLNKKSK